MPPPSPFALLSPIPPLIVKPEIVVWFGKPNSLTAVVFPFASIIELAGPSPAIMLMVLSILLFMMDQTSVIPKQ